MGIRQGVSTTFESILRCHIKDAEMVRGIMYQDTMTM